MILKVKCFYLKRIFDVNFRIDKVAPKNIFEQILKLRLSNVFPNVLIALRIFLSLPATVASNERSFSVLKRIKSFFRSTMSQECLNGLAMLNIYLIFITSVGAPYIIRIKKRITIILNNHIKINI